MSVEGIKLPGWVENLMDDEDARAAQQRFQEENRWRIAGQSQDEVMLSYARREVELAEANRAVGIEGEETRIFENLLVLGMLDEAMPYAESLEQREKITNLRAALNRPDNQKCTCEDREVTVKGRKVTVSRFIEDGKVFSEEHGFLVPIEKCSICGFTNATPNINGE